MQFMLANPDVAATYTSYDDFMAGIGATNIKLFIKSNKFGYWGSVQKYKDGRGRYHQLDLAKDPRVPYKIKLTALTKNKNKLKLLQNKLNKNNKCYRKKQN